MTALCHTITPSLQGPPSGEEGDLSHIEHPSSSQLLPPGCGRKIYEPPNFMMFNFAYGAQLPGILRAH